MAVLKCSSIAVIALLISLSLCSASAHRLQSSTFPDNTVADKISDEPDPEASHNSGVTEGDSKWIRGGGGRGGYPGAGGYGPGGSGWIGGGDSYPRPPPTAAAEPFYCRPVTCGDPYTCPGFTLYFNQPAAASYMSKDVVHGDEKHRESGGAVAPGSG
ncbi:hypothetical protein OROGR_007095 [Orobanche gracilis]